MKLPLLPIFLLLISCAGTSPRYSAENSSLPRSGREKNEKKSDSGTISVRRRELHGEASWYGDRFNGRKTASGESFDMNAFTAAHRTIPFNTIVEVTDDNSGKSVKVRINDRGPTIHRRIIDLSKGAASKLGILEKGVADVHITVVKNP